MATNESTECNMWGLIRKGTVSILFPHNMERVRLSSSLHIWTVFFADWKDAFQILSSLSCKFFALANSVEVWIFDVLACCLFAIRILSAKPKWKQLWLSQSYDRAALYALLDEFSSIPHAAYFFLQSDSASSIVCVVWLVTRKYVIKNTG